MLGKKYCINAVLSLITISDSTESRSRKRSPSSALLLTSEVNRRIPQMHDYPSIYRLTIPYPVSIFKTNSYLSDLQQTKIAVLFYILKDLKKNG